MAMNMGVYQVLNGRSGKQFLKKNRWTMKISNNQSGSVSAGSSSGFYGQGPQESIVYIASRPSLTFTEQELHHAVETIYYPVRPTWEPIEVNMWNVAGDSMAYEWLRQIYDTSSPAGSMGFWKDIVRTVTITMLNGIGEECEKWSLVEAWPSNINFGELDHTSTEIADIRFTLRYSRAKCEIQPSGGGQGSDG